jgi:hypothetical protein
MTDSIREILPVELGQKLVNLGEVSPAGGIPLANVEEVLDALAKLNVVVLGGSSYVRGSDGISTENKPRHRGLVVGSERSESTRQ